MNMLSHRHRTELETDSAISPEIIAERGYRTINDPAVLPDAFEHYQRRTGLLIPIPDVTGEVVAWQLKADQPRIGKDGKPIKYDTAAGGRQCLDVPARSLPHLGNPAVPMWITEGAKKVDSGLTHGIRCIVGLQGVYGFRGTNKLGGKVVIPDFESIALNGRDVILAFDSDVMTKQPVRSALDRLSAILARHGAKVRYLLMPDLPDGAKCGLDDFRVHKDAKHLADYIVDALPDPEPSWEPPIPLDDPTGPPFPVDALPGAIGDITRALAEETQTAPDMAASVALGTISAAAGGRYEVVIPEHGWREPVHIQGVTVAEPAQRKTEIFRKLTQPIVDYERDVNPEERKALAQWESRGRVLEKQLASAEQAGAKADDPAKVSNAEAVRMAAVDELEAHHALRPRMTQVITDDATPEAVKSLLAEQGGAIAAMSAESAFLSNTTGGRYSDAPNLDVLLNGHAGDRIRVDRKGRPSETVERASLTLCLMVQPDVIRDLGKSQGFIARGGAARLLPSFPPDMLGHRRIDVAPVPRELTERWDRAIRAIVTRKPDMQEGSYIPWKLELSTEAKDRFRDYRIWHESLMGKDGAYADIRDWAGKQAGTVLRIAGLLHIADHDAPEAVRISADTMDRAIVIANYYAEHARIMYKQMRGRSGHKDAQIVLDAIRALGSPTTRRDVHRKLHNRAAFASSDSLSEPFAVLEELGYTKHLRATTGKGGRPSEQIFLNPSEMDDKTDRTPQQESPGTGFVSSVIVSQEKEARPTVADDPPREMTRPKGFTGPEVAI